MTHWACIIWVWIELNDVGEYLLRVCWLTLMVVEDEVKKRLDHVQTELQTRWRAG